MKFNADTMAYLISVMSVGIVRILFLTCSCKRYLLLDRAGRDISTEYNPLNAIIYSSIRWLIRLSYHSWNH